MSNPIRIVRVLPGAEPEVATIPNTLEALQAEVGGYIESVGSFSSPSHSRFAVYVNEDGRALALAPNRVAWGHRIVGTIVISRVRHDGDQMTMTDDDVATALAEVRSWGAWAGPYGGGS